MAMATSEYRVLSVEYVMKAKVSGGRVHEDFTEAMVGTPLGVQFISVPGFFAERKHYQLLIDVAMNAAWHKFCHAA